MTPRPGVTIEAPAKINLGLEILGKRPDGYHEIRSVMVMLELSDTLCVFVDGPANGMELPGVAAGENLIAVALDVFRRAVPGCPELAWSIKKRIPAGAGLGGASSDAAAALIAANQLANNPLSRQELAHIAGTIGSDVPFFLGSPVAHATGRGTDLVALPPVDTPVVLLVPRVTIQEKTRTLYSMIEPADMSDGTRSDAVRHAIAANRYPTAADLANAFSRPLSLLVPGVLELQHALQDTGNGLFGLSGAGPAHYVIGQEARDIVLAGGLGESLRDRVDIIPTRTRLSPMVVDALAIHD